MPEHRIFSVNLLNGMKPSKNKITERAKRVENPFIIAAYKDLTIRMHILMRESEY